MRITANQLTLFRIVLIPIPCAILIMGGQEAKLVAWALYIAIGITDFFDGMLARKYGSTKLGSLLDPIADKIYIALLFLPMAVTGIAPLWLVIALLIRDPIVTSLRSLSQIRGLVLKTASFAQYKTAIEMITGGYMIWVFVVPDKKTTLIAMFVVFLLCLGWFIAYWIWKKKIHPRLVTLVGMVALALGIRAVLSVETTILVYGLVVLLVTWVSAIHYIIIVGMNYSSSNAKASIDWIISTFLESVVIFFFVLILLDIDGLPVWVPIGVISLELALGAFDNFITSERMIRNRMGTWCKVLLQLLIIGIILFKVYYPSKIPFFIDYEIWVDGYLLFGITMLYFIFIATKYSRNLVAKKI